MSTNPSDPPMSEVDPAEVDLMIGSLARLSDVSYAESLADCIMDPDPVERAAFRSPALVERSVIAAKYLIETTNSRIRAQAPLESNRAWERRAAHFRDRVGMERRLLDRVVADNIEA